MHSLHSFPLQASPALIPIEEVMRRCGLDADDAHKRANFRRHAHRTGLLKIRITRRTLRYDPLQAEAWIRSRRSA